METLKINKITSTIKGRSGLHENVFSYKGLNIYFSGNYYAVIDGLIPLEVADAIYKKYPNNEFGIRVNGGAINLNPNKYAIYCENKRYVRDFHVDTKEGLIILLTEIIKYNEKKEDMYNFKTWKDYLSQINDDLIEDLNLNVSSDMWLENNNAKELIENKNSHAKNCHDVKIRELLDEFDYLVNPASYGEMQLSNGQKYSDLISIYFSKDRDEVQIDYSAIDKSFDIKHMRNSKYLTYTLSFKDGNSKFLVHHYYSIKEKDNFEEVICVFVSDINKSDSYEIRYNLITGKVVANNSNQNINEWYKAIIIENLEKAINFLESVMIDNIFEMKKSELVRTLNKSKKWWR